MPIYDYECNCQIEPKTYSLQISFSNYEPEIPCPCGSGNLAKRKFTAFSVTNGLTANEKKTGTTNNRKNMGEFMKDQRELRKKSYDPTTREAKSNEIWLGKEGLDGITSLPTDRK